MTKKQCLPCERFSEPLNQQEIKEKSITVPDWSVSFNPDIIERVFTLDSFVQAIDFVNQIALIAEFEQHHPEMSIQWNNVTCILHTHAIKGLSFNDFTMAQLIDKAFNALKKHAFYDASTSIEAVRAEVRSFVNERDWQQFHKPKNLSMALVQEATELMEFFLWCSAQESIEIVQKNRSDIEDELADVLLACLCFANAIDMNLSARFFHKIKRNKEKYPVEKARGKWDKYTTYLKKQ